MYISYTDNDKVIRESEWHFKTFDEYIELFTDYVDIEQMLKFQILLCKYGYFLIMELMSDL